MHAGSSELRGAPWRDVDETRCAVLKLVGAKLRGPICPIPRRGKLSPGSGMVRPNDSLGGRFTTWMLCS